MGKKEAAKASGKGQKSKKAVSMKKKRLNPPAYSKYSLYVGVSFSNLKQVWQAHITINGKSKGLGCSHDEKEAARMYDEQAALLGRPVNFPLHEGMEQAVKPARKGSRPKKCLLRMKSKK